MVDRRRAALIRCSRRDWYFRRVCVSRPEGRPPFAGQQGFECAGIFGPDEKPENALARCQGEAGFAAVD